MMNQVEFSPWLHKLLWCEAAQTATDMDVILPLNIIHQEHLNKME